MYDIAFRITKPPTGLNSAIEILRGLHSVEDSFCFVPSQSNDNVTDIRSRPGPVSASCDRSPTKASNCCSQKGFGFCLCIASLEHYLQFYSSIQVPYAILPLDGVFYNMHFSCGFFHRVIIPTKITRLFGI